MIISLVVYLLIWSEPSDIVEFTQIFSKILRTLGNIRKPMAHREKFKFYNQF